MRKSLVKKEHHSRLSLQLVHYEWMYFMLSAEVRQTDMWERKTPGKRPLEYINNIHNRNNKRSIRHLNITCKCLVSTWARYRMYLSKDITRTVVVHSRTIKTSRNYKTRQNTESDIEGDSELGSMRQETTLAITNGTINFASDTFNKGTDFEEKVKY